MTTLTRLPLVQLLELRLDDVIRQGRASLAEKDAIIAASLETSFEIQLGGGEYGTCLVSADHQSLQPRQLVLLKLSWPWEAPKEGEYALIKKGKRYQ